MRAADGRHLDWDGCFNVRDLGGLPTADGSETRRGAIVRSDAPDRLTAAGWAALWAHGVRTIVDLRNDDELRDDVAPRPDDVTTVHVPLDSIEDREFWDEWASGGQFGTPLYYAPFLERFPQRTAAAIAAIAGARPGGVLFHCMGGRDRSGMICILLLALAGVAPEDIVADYSLSRERLSAYYANAGEPDQGDEIDAYFARERTSAGEVIIGLLESLDVQAYLRGGGLPDDDLAALRARLLTG